MTPDPLATSHPEANVRPALLLGLLGLLPALLTPWVGAWALGISGLLLLVLVLVQLLASRRPWVATLAAGAALLGGLVAVSSAGLAVATLGAVPPYDTRVGFGWLALGLAVAATAAGIVARARPVAGSTLMALGGLLGAGAISFFSIDTFYWAAVPLWLLAAVLALAGPHRTH